MNICLVATYPRGNRSHIPSHPGNGTFESFILSELPKIQLNFLVPCKLSYRIHPGLMIDIYKGIPINESQILNACIISQLPLIYCGFCLLDQIQQQLQVFERRVRWLGWYLWECRRLFWRYTRNAGCFCVISCTSSKSAMARLSGFRRNFICPTPYIATGRWVIDEEMSSAIPEIFFRLDKYCWWKLMEYKESFTSQCIRNNYISHVHKVSCISTSAGFLPSSVQYF